TINPTPRFDYANAFNKEETGATDIHNSTTLQTAFSNHNALTAPSTSLHYAPNANFANGGYAAAGDPGADGFNLADTSSKSVADALPSGDKALLDMTSFLSTGDTS